MPLVNVIRGERLDSAPINVRTPFIRIPLWMALSWWVLRGLGRLLVVAVRFWYVTAPAALFAWLYLRYGWVSPVGLVLAVAGVSAGWWFAHRTSFERFAWFPAVSRYRRWSYRRAWHPAMATAKLVVSFDGHIVMPILKRVRCTAGADVVLVRMVTGQIPDDFAKQADRLAHTFRVRSVKVAPGPRPDLVALTLLRGDPLARLVPPLPVPSLPDFTALPIAKREDGETYELRLFGTQVLVVGATGAGKGSVIWSFVRTLAAGIASGLVELWVFDPKGGMELGAGMPLFARFACDDYAAMADMLEEAVKTMRERTARLRGKTRQHTPTVGDPLIVIVIDERRPHRLPHRPAPQRPACATKARKLRQQQIREGWHRDDEPDPGPEPATEAQRALIVLRGHLEFDRAALMAAHMDPETRAEQVAAVDAAICEVEAEITAEGLRGRPAPPHPDPNDQDDDADGGRRVRSTKRRQDAPDLPRLPVENRTLGRTFEGRHGKVFRPSMFLTLTLDSYGRVREDGTPVSPDSYDYRRAAWDAVHFPRLLDRFWQNLRRAVGWKVQYAGAVEPQRRLAPHAHFAMRGTIPRELVRQVAAATYHQVWWPPTDHRVFEPGQAPEWDEQADGYTDPATGRLLPTWDDALDLLDADPDAEPMHVVRFGRQVDAKGVLAGTKDADRCVWYITKYLTKQAADCHTTSTQRQRAHLDRLWSELRYTPCSERCANWLLYGAQPKKARPGLKPGNCKAKVHKRETLGLGGRRVLISRQWSGKTLADHRADRREWVKALLGVTTDADHTDNPAADGQPSASRHAWEMAHPTDPDVAPLAHRLLRAISERIQWRNQLDHARRAGPPAPPRSRQPTRAIRPGRRHLMDKMLTIDEAAERLNMSPRYVRRLVAERRIAFHKLGRSVRLAESDIAAFAAAGRVEPLTTGSVWRELRRVAA